MKFEIYKLFVESSMAVSNWQHSSNTFYVSVNAAMTGLQSLVDCSLIIPILAIVPINVLWLLSIEHYKKLNKAKFKVINKMEKDLPFRPFQEEYEFYKKERRIDFSSIEKYTPIVFGLIHLAFIIYRKYFS